MIKHRAVACKVNREGTMHSALLFKSGRDKFFNAVIA